MLYSFKCPICGRVEDAFQTLAQHEANPTPLACHERPMERFYTASSCPALGLTNDRIYQDMRATDGTDISSRAKHREYMRRNNLTTIDDFTETWKQAARERAENRDPTRRTDVVEAVKKLGG